MVVAVAAPAASEDSPVKLRLGLLLVLLELPTEVTLSSAVVFWPSSLRGEAMDG
jgi:hypothetical protein